MQRACAPLTKVLLDTLDHRREADVGVSLVLHDVEDRAEDVRHALRVGDVLMLQGVNDHDVDQFLDVVLLVVGAVVVLTDVAGLLQPVVSKEGVIGVSAYSITVDRVD